MPALFPAPALPTAQLASAHLSAPPATVDTYYRPTTKLATWTASSRAAASVPALSLKIAPPAQQDLSGLSTLLLTWADVPRPVPQVPSTPREPPAWPAERPSPTATPADWCQLPLSAILVWLGTSSTATSATSARRPSPTAPPATLPNTASSATKGTTTSTEPATTESVPLLSPTAPSAGPQPLRSASHVCLVSPWSTTSARPSTAPTLSFSTSPP